MMNLKINSGYRGNYNGTFNDIGFSGYTTTKLYTIIDGVIIREIRKDIEVSADAILLTSKDGMEVFGDLPNTIKGDTYSVRYELKQFGYKWNAEKSVWEK